MRVIASSLVNLGRVGVGSTLPIDMQYSSDGNLYGLYSKASGSSELILRSMLRSDGRVGLRQAAIDGGRLELDIPILELSDSILLGAALSEVGDRAGAPLLDAAVQYTTTGFGLGTLIAGGVVAAILIAITGGLALGAITITATAGGGVAIATASGGLVATYSAGAGAGALYASILAAQFGLSTAVISGGVVGISALAAALISAGVIVTGASATVATLSAISDAAQGAKFDLYRFAGADTSARRSESTNPTGSLTPYSAWGGKRVYAGVVPNTRLNQLKTRWESTNNNADLAYKIQADNWRIPAEIVARLGAGDPAAARRTLERFIASNKAAEKAYGDALTAAYEIRTSEPRVLSGINAFAQRGSDSSVVIAVGWDGTRRVIRRYTSSGFTPIPGGDLGELLGDRYGYALGGAIAYDGSYLYMVAAEGNSPVLLRVTITNISLDAPASFAINRGVTSTELPFPEATGASGSVAYSIYNRGTRTPAQLPRGLSWRRLDRQIVGTVSQSAQARVYEYDYVARDAAGAEALQPFTITVSAAPLLPAPELGPYDVGVTTDVVRLPAVLGVTAVERASYRYSISGNQPPGFPDFTSRQNLRLESWTPTRAGIYRMRYSATSRTTRNPTPVDFTISVRQPNRPPTLTVPEPGDAVVFGEWVSVVLAASDPDADSLEWTFTTRKRQPNGLFADVSRIPGVSLIGIGSAGRIVGRPTEAGAVYEIGITVVDGRGGTASDTYVLAIGSDNPALPSAFATPVDQTYELNRAITDEILPAVLRPGDAVYSYTISGLPPGLVYTQLTRTVSGTPTTAGTYTVTYTATRVSGTKALPTPNNGADAAVRTYAITVAAPTETPTLTQRDLGPYTVGQAIPTAIALDTVRNAGAATYTYSISGTLPTELVYAPFSHALVRADAVTTPNWAASGTYDLTLQASAPGRETLTADFDIVVNAVEAPPPVISESSLSQPNLSGTTMIAGQWTTVEVTNPPAGASYTYSVTRLPSWLSYNAATRTLSGTPPRTGGFTMTLTATLAGGEDANAPLSSTFTLVVRPPAGDPQIRLFANNRDSRSLSGEYDADGRPILYLQPGAALTLVWLGSNLLARQAAGTYALQVYVNSVGLSAGQPGYVSYDSRAFANQTTLPPGQPGFAAVSITAGRHPATATMGASDVYAVGTRRTHRGLYTLDGGGTRQRTWTWYDELSSPGLANLNAVPGVEGTSVVYRVRLTRVSDYRYGYISGRYRSSSGGAVYDDQGNELSHFSGLYRVGSRIRSAPSPALLAQEEIRVIWRRYAPFRWAREQPRQSVVRPQTPGEGQMPHVWGAVGGVPPITVRTYGTSHEALPDATRVSGRHFRAPDSLLRAEPNNRVEYGLYHFTTIAYDSRPASAGGRQLLYKSFSVRVVNPPSV